MQEGVLIKLKTNLSPNKCMATVFLDRTEYCGLTGIRTNAPTSDYYMGDLKELREMCVYSLQHDNSKPHVSAKTDDAIRHLRFKYLPHLLSPIYITERFLSGEMKECCVVKELASSWTGTGGKLPGNMYPYRNYKINLLYLF